MRERSAEEQAFIEEALESRQDAPGALPPKELKKKRSKARAATGYKPPWKRLSNWAAAVLLIPLALTSLFMYGLMRTREMMGAETLEWLSDQELPEEFTETATQNGVSWLPDFLAVYANKELIIGGTFTVAIIIVALILTYDVLVVQRREESEEVDDEEED